MKQTHRLGGAVLTGLMALMVVPGPAAAEQMASEAGLGAASALSTLVYGPVKLLYAASGLIFGGIAWGLSGGDSDVMMAVVTPAVRGDYVITPQHLRMEDRVEFFGVNVTVNQTPERVRKYLAERHPPFRTLYDNEGAVTRAYQAPTTSFVVIIDRVGKVAYTGVGASQDLATALRAVTAP